MKDKCKNEADLVVCPDGRTLVECMHDSGITSADKLTTDDLNMKAGRSAFQRFDHFNDSYNPMGKADLRTIFMKTSNKIDGRFFAELMREVVMKRCSSKHTTKQALEPRLSIYGFGLGEWTSLAHFFVKNNMAKPDNVKWLIQVPRLCNIFMGKTYNNFGELMQNIFDPIVQATLHPEKHSELHILLSNIGGFDSVDDESVVDDYTLKSPDSAVNSAFGFTEKKNPPYNYWMFFMSENLALVNTLREKRGLNTFKFAPHSGESGPDHHLASAFLTSHVVQHGVNVAKLPVLMYLFYLTELPMGVCPMSNNKLFLRLEDSPVRKFAKVGMNFSLNTDDPLQFHSTNDPLLEEYLISTAAFKLSTHDVSEIALNSVKMSHFDHATKEKWVGKGFHLPHSQFDWFSCPDKTNITSIRSEFRHNRLMSEIGYVYEHGRLADHANTKKDPKHWKEYFDNPNPIMIGNYLWVPTKSHDNSNVVMVTKGEDDKLK